MSPPGGPDDPGHASGHDRSGWGGTLRPGRRPALLLIDMVRAYFDAGGAFELPSTRALESATRLLDAARSSGVPVVHTCVRYAPDGADGGVFFRKVAGLRVFATDTSADPDGPGAIRPEVAPLEGEVVVVKQMPSAFFGTSLAGTLVARGVDTLVVGGVSTSGCVRATVVDAMSHGFVPLVVADACGDRLDRVHEANLGDLAAKYAEVIDLQQGLDYLASVG